MRRHIGVPAIARSTALGSIHRLVFRSILEICSGQVSHKPGFAVGFARHLERAIADSDLALAHAQKSADADHRSKNPAAAINKQFVNLADTFSGAVVDWLADRLRCAPMRRNPGFREEQV